MSDARLPLNLGSQPVLLADIAPFHAFMSNNNSALCVRIAQRFGWNSPLLAGIHNSMMKFACNFRLKKPLVLLSSAAVVLLILGLACGQNPATAPPPAA